MGYMNYDRLAVAIIRQGLQDYEDAFIKLHEKRKSINLKGIHITDADKKALQTAEYKVQHIEDELNSEFCRQLIDTDVLILTKEIRRRIENDGERIFR